MLAREGRVDNKVVHNVIGQTVMPHNQRCTRKGSAFHTNAFRGYHSLRRFGQHHVMNDNKQYVDRKIKKSHQRH